MTSADPSVLAVNHCADHHHTSGEQGGESLLPEHACEQCMSLCFAADHRCVECGRARPTHGWTRLDDSGDPWLGQIIKGRYLLTRRLGRGASASVYEAESLRVRRRVAVKIVDCNACTCTKDPHLVRTRLKREIEAIARLNHPHTVPLYEVMELSPSCVGVVMGYVAGQTLNELLDQVGGALDWKAACELLGQLARGVQAVHRAGLIHRDLKPANIMVERLPSGDAFIRILDFGVVWMDDGVDVTTGFVGTPLYASPEQALDEGVDGRSDIYSLGVIFFEMLTGRPPFESNSVMEVLRMQVRQSPPSLATASGGRHFPRPLCRLVEQMLAKDRDARPVDLAEVIETLDAITSGQLDATRTPQPPVKSLGARAAASTEHTHHGLGVIERVADGASTVAPPPDASQDVFKLGDEPADLFSSDEFFSQAISAVDSLGNPDSLFESDEHDTTGPKAAIFRPRTSPRHQPLPRPWRDA